MEDNLQEMIDKIDFQHECHMDVPGNFGRSMNISMSEAFLFRRLLSEEMKREKS